MSTEDFKFAQYTYRIRFERTERNYRLIHYNSPWDNDRDLEDMRIMFEGKDLEDNDLSPYKVLNWEALSPGKYDALVDMVLYKPKGDGPHEQKFFFKMLEPVESVEE